PSLNSQPAFCTWNTSFDPQTSAGIDNCPNVSLVYDPVGRALYPVACVDWCDAYAYCHSLGKRLCGSFQGQGVPMGSGSNATVDEWYAACSAAGAKSYPYDGPYNGYLCNTLEYNQSGSIRVGDDVNCVGAYGYLWDMSGNVSEWEDACNGATGANDTC